MRSATACVLGLLAMAACTRAQPLQRPIKEDAAVLPRTAVDPPHVEEAKVEEPRSDAAAGDAGPVEIGPPPPRPVGPFEAPLYEKGKRKVYYSATPGPRQGGTRLMANLHGVCNPPGYACGYWVDTAKDFGFLVCPEGDGSCGPGAYNAPTWNSGNVKMEEDLERAIEVVSNLYPGEIVREGGILTGFSRGAYAAPEIARRHPGRWPYLILNEADVALDAASLRKSGVKAVALIAGEYGTQLAGERQTARNLAAQKFPVKLWVMPKAGHHYSGNIAEIMREAIEFVLAQE